MYKIIIIIFIQLLTIRKEYMVYMVVSIKMVYMCCVCKQIPEPLINRSAYRFPKDENLQNIWLKETGLEKVTPSSRICSDHFDQNDFIPSSSTKSRLKPIAVPKCQPISSEVSGVSTDDSSLPSNNDAQSFPLGITIDDHQTPANDTTSLTHDIQSPSNNRKLGGLYRRDFTSDTAWQLYKKNHFQHKNLVKVLKKNIYRKNERQKKMLEMVDELKSKTVYDYANFSEVNEEK